jgi:glycosyltransferase involved in cell wall biosynthesis
MEGKIAPVRRPKVSIIIVTYNHAQFLVEAVTSALNQETEFETEILIGEDESTDGTRELAQRLAAEYPQKIRLFLGSRSEVVKIHGRVTGRKNLHRLLTNAAGEYIAMLDGDDYWIDPAKLQKQVHYMDSHRECVVLGTDAWIATGAERLLFSKRYWKTPGTSFSLKQVMNGEFIPPTCSIMFRRSTLDFPQIYWETIVGDMVLFAICGRWGTIDVLPEPMAVYRVNPGGVYTQGAMPGARAKASPAAAERLGHTALMFEQFMDFLGPNYHSALRGRCTELHRDIAWMYQECGDYRGMNKHALSVLKHGGLLGPRAWEAMKLLARGVLALGRKMVFSGVDWRL